VGEITGAEPQGGAVVLTIAPRRWSAAELELGESVAVDGVCLTVTEHAAGAGAGWFRVLAGAETLARTTVGRMRPGQRVNLERALCLGDRMGGHWVQGHVDGVAALCERRDLGANLELGFRPPTELLRYLVAKGSVAIDGISLTVNRVDATSFSVALIPHTVDNTALASKQPGDLVNIEVDLIGKYVERLLAGYLPGGVPGPAGAEPAARRGPSGGDLPPREGQG
jgi:riboflavin synthase